jgi:phospholipid/cholesterol/gamma-HCH transport system substrate-binding protein
MADSNRSALRVGILLAAGLSIFAFAVLTFGHGTRFLSGGESFEAHFQRINGLQTGAPVMLRGVRVGAVEGIEFPGDPSADYVVVRLWIQNGAAMRVRADSQAKIASLGVLGDKFVVLTGGTPDSPTARAGTVLPSVDPVDYATLLQRKGTHDTLANVLAITESMRTLIDAVNNGHGLAHELFYSEATDSNQRTLTLESLRATVDAARQTVLDLDVILRRAESGKGIMGALFNGDGRRLDANLQAAAASARTATEALAALAQRYRNADGAIPQLMENREYAREVMDNLRQSSADLEQILHKINAGQGTIGKLVNNPALYDSAQKLVATQGWGVAFIKAIYGVLHPLSSTEPGPDGYVQPQIAQGNLVGQGSLALPHSGSSALSLHGDPAHRCDNVNER